jgi:hypothetical protein
MRYCVGLRWRWLATGKPRTCFSGHLGVVHYGDVTATPSMRTKSLEISNSFGYWSF